jgi:peptidoglycan/xylan/chitin deacetylase (PgdA/CDA1 family)
LRLQKLWKKVLFVCFIGVVALLAYTEAYPPKGVPILEYHMVNDKEADTYAVPTAEFKEQLDYLREQGYQTISMLDFMKAKKGKLELPAKPIILTFDDGYEDNYTELLPILERYDMKATVFMVTNFIGTEGYLSWDQLRDMQTRGIEIGSHTANHNPVSELTDDEIRDELGLSKLLLEWNGIHTVYFFSYPNGIYNKTALDLLPKDDYLGAVTGHAGLNTFSTDPYLLQRTNIPRPHFGLLEFKLRLLKTEIFTRLGILQHTIK